MEKLISIAEILKEKPKGTKLWSDTFGELTLNRIKDVDEESYPISLTAENNYSVYLTKNGFYFEDVDGVSLCVFPSRNMRDWGKFTWKKGDVLVSDKGEHCFFYGWSTGDYEKFEGRYSSSDNYSEKSSINTFTYKWEKETKDFVIDKYIKEVESKNNAKLNLKTLELETKKPEFKNGDIVTVASAYTDITICIVKSIKGNRLEYYASEYMYSFHAENWLNTDGKVVSLATDSEKQKLFNIIANEGKYWNSDTKQIEDLPKKCKFEPMDYVLVKSKKDNYAIWNLYQFAYKGINTFCMVGNTAFIIADNNFLPYNDRTKHLLGTPDEWKGGAE